MKHLAPLIRKGLAIPGIIQDPLIYGAGIFNKEISANVIGVALIGKVGVPKALDLFSAALDGDEKAIAEIDKALGIEIAITEFLVMKHQDMSAEEIADQIEQGTITAEQAYS